MCDVVLGTMYSDRRCPFRTQYMLQTRTLFIACILLFVLSVDTAYIPRGTITLIIDFRAESFVVSRGSSSLNTEVVSGVAWTDLPPASQKT